MFIVEMLIGNEWENVWHVEDEPELFETAEAAEIALRLFMKDAAEAGLEGYDLDRFRIVGYEA